MLCFVLVPSLVPICHFGKQMKQLAQGQTCHTSDITTFNTRACINVHSQLPFQRLLCDTTACPQTPGLVGFAREKPCRLSLRLFCPYLEHSNCSLSCHGLPWGGAAQMVSAVDDQLMLRKTEDSLFRKERVLLEKKGSYWKTKGFTGTRKVLARQGLKG